MEAPPPWAHFSPRALPPHLLTGMGPTVSIIQPGGQTGLKMSGQNPGSPSKTSKGKPLGSLHGRMPRPRVSYRDDASAPAHVAVHTFTHTRAHARTCIRMHIAHMISPLTPNSFVEDLAGKGDETVGASVGGDANLLKPKTEKWGFSNSRGEVW